MEVDVGDVKNFLTSLIHVQVDIVAIIGRKQ